MSRAIRSPLLKALIGAAQKSAGHEPASSSPSRLASSRRRFLGGALAFGATGCATGSRARRRTARDERVLVIGAGLGGLVCAHRLHQQGVRVTLYEASTRVGGRVFSDATSFPDSQVVEFGGELVDSGHVAIQSLCAELGLELDDLRAEATGLEPTYWIDGRSVAETDLARMLRPAVDRMRREVAAMKLSPVPHRSGGSFPVLDQWSIERWLAEARIESPARELIEVAFTTELGLEPDVLSCIPMLQMLTVSRDKLFLYGESDERYHVRGGSQKIATELATRLHHRIETETWLEALARRSDGRIVASFARGAQHFEIVAERVVVAVPFSVLRDVSLHPNLAISKRKRTSIDALGYGTNAKLLLGFSSRAWRTQNHSGEVFSTLPFQTTWDGSRAQPGDAGVLVNFTGGARGLALGRGSIEALRDEVLRDVDRVIPGLGAAANGQARRFHWPTHPTARGSYSTWLVGQLSSFGGVEGEVEGHNLHFAGEHTSLVAAGYMEGAAESGERVAAEILHAGARS